MNGLMMKYFVLKPAGCSPHSLASREALRVYADMIESTNHALASDIREWINLCALEADTGLPVVPNDILS
jgi:hypothetical protein